MDLIIELTIVGILFIVLIVAITLISLKGRRNRKRKSADIEVTNNNITLELALVSDESSLTPVVQTPKPSVTRI
jgi:ABC-type bacteriocin/lantibiotic exporter with double-glycine peptidase domain